jgi:hypothetical protein
MSISHPDCKYQNTTDCISSNWNVLAVGSQSTKAEQNSNESQQLELPSITQYCNAPNIWLQSLLSAIKPKQDS